jgi:SAM-dependent methyltransferase
VTFCQTCPDVEVSKFLSLGMQPTCLFPANATEAENEQTWPLDLGFCPRCSLVQIMEPVSERILFAGDYHDVIGLMGGYRRHLRDLAELLTVTSHGGSVVEIGSNHGILLDELATQGFDVLGIDPNAVDSPDGPPVIKEFFGAELATRLLSTTGQADVVVALNTLAHITNLPDFLAGVRTILRPNGMFVSESHYLPDLLGTLQYDFAYHEHSRYYSLTALDAAFARHGLEVFRTERIPTHAGSLRVYAGFAGAHEVHDSVAAVRAYEDILQLTNDTTYRKFAARVEDHRVRLRSLLSELTSKGARIAAATSPARSATLLTYCALGPAELDYVSEVNPRKIGKLTPGAHIPVVDQRRLCGPEQPDYALLLSWHVAEELVPRLRKEGFGGRFIIPLPEPGVLDE